jgi:hypothetical protein
MTSNTEHGDKARAWDVAASVYLRRYENHFRILSRAKLPPHVSECILRQISASIRHFLRIERTDIVQEILR